MRNQRTDGPLASTMLSKPVVPWLSDRAQISDGRECKEWRERKWTRQSSTTDVLRPDKHEDECMESTTRVLKCGGQNTGEYVSRSVMGSKSDRSR